MRRKRCSPGAAGIVSTQNTATANTAARTARAISHRIIGSPGSTAGLLHRIERRCDGIAAARASRSNMVAGLTLTKCAHGPVCGRAARARIGKPHVTNNQHAHLRGAAKLILNNRTSPVLQIVDARTFSRISWRLFNDPHRFGPFSRGNPAHGRRADLLCANLACPDRQGTAGRHGEELDRLSTRHRGHGALRQPGFGPCREQSRAGERALEKTDNSFFRRERAATSCRDARQAGGLDAAGGFRRCDDGTRSTRLKQWATTPRKATWRRSRPTGRTRQKPAAPATAAPRNPAANSVLRKNNAASTRRGGWPRSPPRCAAASPAYRYGGCR